MIYLRIFFVFLQGRINTKDMDLLNEHNKKYQFFVDITGVAMKVYNKYHYGLLESAYEAAMQYLLELNGHKVERQVFLPIYWDNVKLNQNYRLDLVIDDDIIIELKTVQYVSDDHRRQLKNYLNITHKPYGMLINFSPDRIYSEWYERFSSGDIERIKLF